MASSGKKKTTMAKLMRETKLRERRMDKQARKEARKNAPPVDPDAPVVLEDPFAAPMGEAAGPGADAVAEEVAGVSAAG
jgi:hypothetical protein